MKPDVKFWELERYLLGELPPRRREAIRRLAEADSTLQERLAELSRSDKEIMDRYTPGDEAVEIRAVIDRGKIKEKSDRTLQPEFGYKNILSGRLPRVVPVAAAGLLVLILGGFLAVTILRFVSEPGLRIKGVTQGGGEPRIQIHRKTAFADVAVNDGATVRAGDLLHISYSPGNARYGVILSLDGKGTVTLHFPDEENGPTKLRPGRNIPLSSVYELDASPEFERFIFVTSSKPIDVGTLLKRAAILGRDLSQARTKRLDLPDELRQFSFLLHKGSRT